MKNEKGITLIALVITIIVMLILVTVTIRVATNGNLFTHAANAVKGTKTAIAGENDILNDNLDKSIEDIVAEQTETATLIHFTIGGTPYDAEEDMTWGAWMAKPKYNVDGFKAGEENVSDEPDNPQYFVLRSDGQMLVGWTRMDPKTHQLRVFYCYTEDIISDGFDYSLREGPN